MQTQVSKWGNSLGIRIPQNLAKKLNITPGKKINLTLVDDNKLIIEPEEYELENLVQKITPENSHDFSDWGEPQGKEIW